MRRSTLRASVPSCLRAFTLFEVLVAIALMLVLVGVMGTFLMNLLRTRARTIEYTEQQRAASVLLQRLETDLATCLVGDASRGAGVAGDEHSLRVLTRSVPVREAERGAADPVVVSDLERAEYRFANERVEASRTVVTAGGRARGGGFESFGGRVSHLRFRFHDGREWLGSFDSLNAGRLPAAIEVAIWFDPWPGEAAEDPFGDDAFLDPPDEDFPRPGDFSDLGPPLDDRDLPFPDRVRVIAIPDTRGEVDAEAGP